MSTTGWKLPSSRLLAALYPPPAHVSPSSCFPLFARPAPRQRARRGAGRQPDDGAPGAAECQRSKWRALPKRSARTHCAQPGQPAAALFKSVITGDISPHEVGRAAAFNYRLGKLDAGFKVPGRTWLGLDKIQQPQPLNYSVGSWFFTRMWWGCALATKLTRRPANGLHALPYQVRGRRPAECSVFNHLCIPDSIINAPTQGWQKPPLAGPAILE